MPRKKKELHDEETRRQFEKHFRKTADECWMWQSSKDPDGYGQFKWNGELYRAHRFSYALYKNESIEPGTDIDHTCNNRACVNPDHLENVDHNENMRRQRARAESNPNPGLVPVLRREMTSAELVLSWCLDTVKKRKWKQPDKYNVGLGEAPWRPYLDFDDTTLEADERLSLLALYLYAVSMGVPSYQAGRLILGINDQTLKRWNVNPEWKQDTENARAEGRRARTSALKEKVEDTLEARLGFAEMKDVIRQYEIMTRNEEARRDRRAKKDSPDRLGSGPTFNILMPPGTTTADIAALTEQITEAEYRDVTDEDAKPALPPPDDWDEDFEDDD